MPSKKNKKKDAAEAIARAKAWAMKRRESKNGGVSGSSGTAINNVLQDQKNEDKKNRENMNLLIMMLVKEKRILAETKMKIKLIQNELDKYK